MKLVKRVPPSALLVLLVLVGAGSTLAGVYLLLGLAPTLLVGGVASVTTGLLVDVE